MKNVPLTIPESDVYKNKTYFHKHTNIPRFICTSTNLTLRGEHFS
jgi:hypothetical protein